MVWLIIIVIIIINIVIRIYKYYKFSYIFSINVESFVDLNANKIINKFRFKKISTKLFKWKSKYNYLKFKVYSHYILF